MVLRADIHHLVQYLGSASRSGFFRNCAYRPLVMGCKRALPKRAKSSDWLKPRRPLISAAFAADNAFCFSIYPMPCISAVSRVSGNSARTPRFPNDMCAPNINAEIVGPTCFSGDNTIHITLDSPRMVFSADRAVSPGPIA